MFAGAFASGAGAPPMAPRYIIAREAWLTADATPSVLEAFHSAPAACSPGWASDANDPSAALAKAVEQLMRGAAMRPGPTEPSAESPIAPTEPSAESPFAPWASVRLNAAASEASGGPTVSEATEGNGDEGASAPAARRRIRPCKSKRKLWRRVVEELEERVAQDPESFDAEGFKLPESLKSNGDIVERVRTQLKEAAARAIAAKSS
mmetsp:Transcript_54685/g.158841  ORF Transcript_54685/g.158841 Transcript_54685/m.158841 type:complete len:207 (+) Transcript_54685:81-701(+)